MLHSFFRSLGVVHFPEYQERQFYMHKFEPSNPTMPDGFQDYIQMVSHLCYVARVTNPVFVTIDEKIIQPGMSQRRPGPHVDGCFQPEPDDVDFDEESEANADASYGEEYIAPSGFWGHRPYGSGWNHYCNAVPFKRMPVIVAATVAGCRAWTGDFDATPQNDGDLSHIWEQLGEGTILPPNEAFLLSPDCIHESMIFGKPTKRQFIRLALPVDTEL